MKRILVAWIGKTDLDAQGGIPKAGVGPIARAVLDRNYEGIFLLSNYAETDGEKYVQWLAEKASCPIEFHQKPLSSPTHFGDIYEAAVQVIQKILEKYGDEVQLTYHLSPGTPTMAAVWVIIGKTRYPAELIQSDAQTGVHTASVPFEMSAEYIPDLLRRPDSKLERLSQGLPPTAPEFSDIIHQSDSMRRVLARAQKAAIRSVPVLIEGESGTGKELLARAIHQASPWRDGLKGSPLSRQKNQVLKLIPEDAM